MAKCREFAAVKLSTDSLEAGRRQADADDQMFSPVRRPSSPLACRGRRQPRLKHTVSSSPVGGAPMGGNRLVFEALQRPLTIVFRRHSFHGPAWAVLCAYAMFLTARALLTVAAIAAARFLEPSVVRYVLTIWK
jgi:hypothetical protein